MLMSIKVWDFKGNFIDLYSVYITSVDPEDLRQVLNKHIENVVAHLYANGLKQLSVDLDRIEIWNSANNVINIGILEIGIDPNKGFTNYARTYAILTFPDNYMILSQKN